MIDFQTTRELLNSFDPCEFISAGAPVDEYDYLTTKLMNLVNSGTERDQIRSMIIHELETYFGTPDISNLEEPYQKNFHNDLEDFLERLKTTTNKH